MIKKNKTAANIHVTLKNYKIWKKIASLFIYQMD